jgi:BirA family biotin operon repressor/biotin-[acetyl-CoA-carboxylase] ligase
VSGRGRLGRRWKAPARTAILCSILLRPPATTDRPQLSLVAGLAVAETVESVTGRSAAIKWPNDVLLEDGKVAGILAEARGETIILGIGLNVNQQPPELPADRLPPATSLLVATGIGYDRAPVLVQLLLDLERRYVEWCNTGLPPFRAELAARDALRERQVDVGGVTGVAAGIDELGRLLIESEQGLRAVASGDVTVRSA